MARSLVRDHPLQLGLVRWICDHACVQLVLTFARLGRENVPGECMLPDNLPRPGFFEPFGRTFVCLQFRHDNKIPGIRSVTYKASSPPSPVPGALSLAAHTDTINSCKWGSDRGEKGQWGAGV